MSSPAAIKYLNTVFRTYKDICRFFVFVDSSLPKHYLYDVFPYVEIPDKSLLLYEARVNFNALELALLRKFRIRLLIVGIESFSNGALALLNKGKTAFDNIRFLKNCAMQGIAVNWNILVGIPNETTEMLQQNLEAAKSLIHLYPPTGVWLISFQGNCNYNLNPQEYEIELSPSIKTLSLIYPFEKKVLEDMSYFYESPSSNISHKKAIVIQKIAKSINRWKDRWYYSSSQYLPQLYFKRNNGTIIVEDTRQTEKRQISLDAVEAAVLLYLNDEHNDQEIYQKFASISKDRIAEILHNFIRLRLVFEQDDHYLSLVTEDPGTITYEL